MTDILTLNGLKLSDLQVIPSLATSTRFLVQEGTQFAQAGTISLLEDYLNIVPKIDFAVNQHIQAIDPHGDRSFASSLLISHNSLDNAHGHKTYTDSNIILHSQSPDPHGDRAYSLQLLANHNGLADPHGYKAHVDTKIVEHNEDEDAHDITSRINTTIDNIRGVSNGFAPLDTNEKIPSNYLPSSANPIIFAFSLPATGILNTVYIDLSNNNQYYWTGTTYQKLSNFDIGGVTLTTDDVGESSSNLNRRYFTSTREAVLTSSINLRINNAINVGSGSFIYKEKIGSTLYFKSIVAGTGLEISESSNTITISQIPESIIETEPTDFILQTRTFPSQLTNQLTIDGLALNTTTYENTINYPTEGLCLIRGKVIVSKIKQGTGLESVGKYNRIEEVRSWEVRALIQSYKEWDLVEGFINSASLVDLEITEELVGGISSTTALFTLTLNTDNNAILFNVESNNDLNYVYLWKADFKKLAIKHPDTGTIDHE